MNTNKQCLYSFIVVLLMLFLGSVSVHADLDPMAKASLRASADSLDVYLITCEPHDEVYSLYGHTALRVVDKTRNMDFTTNWGVFDTTASNFVLRFVFGLTDYMCAGILTPGFRAEYIHYGCGVHQQRLALTKTEKYNLLVALFTNMQPENRVYRYNYFYDNCTTRVRDLILGSLERETKEAYVPEMQKGEISFRQMIHQKNADHPWAAFGNDLLLGVQADLNTSHDDREFLPEVLMQDFNAMQVKDSTGMKPLVDSVSWLVKPGVSQIEPMSGFPLSPTVCALVILLAVVALTLFEYYKLHRQLKWFDTVFFYLFALLGLVLTAMIFSKHPTVKINLQIFLFCPLWFWLKSPWTHFRYANRISIVIIVMFFLGNIIQSYAEGMNILALSLLLRIICCEFKDRIYPSGQ